MQIFVQTREQVNFMELWEFWPFLDLPLKHLQRFLGLKEDFNFFLIFFEIVTMVFCLTHRKKPQTREDKSMYKLQ